MESLTAPRFSTRRSSTLAPIGEQSAHGKHCGSDQLCQFFTGKADLHGPILLLAHLIHQAKNLAAQPHGYMLGTNLDETVLHILQLAAKNEGGIEPQGRE